MMYKYGTNGGMKKTLHIDPQLLARITLKLKDAHVRRAITSAADTDAILQALA